MSLYSLHFIKSAWVTFLITQALNLIYIFICPLDFSVLFMVPDLQSVKQSSLSFILKIEKMLQHARIQRFPKTARSGIKVTLSLSPISIIILSQNYYSLLRKTHVSLDISNFLSYNKVRSHPGGDIFPRNGSSHTVRGIHTARLFKMLIYIC